MINPGFKRVGGLCPPNPLKTSKLIYNSCRELMLKFKGHRMTSKNSFQDLNTFRMLPPMRVLLLGDTFVLALVTVFGFARHGEIGSAGLRTLTTFVPLWVSWVLIAPHLGVFKTPYSYEIRQLWRPFWAMILAAPFAAFLRGVLLNTPVQIVFVVVIGGVSALALSAWRLLFWYLQSRGKEPNG
jgi:hypothetical protein